MEFNPSNPIVRYCLQGMALEEQGQTEDAGQLFLRAWEEATHDFEKFIAAYYLAQRQVRAADKLRWTEEAMRLALTINDETVRAALPLLYTNLANCYAALGEAENAEKNRQLASACVVTPADKGPFYHGTRADLPPGDFLTAGNRSNYQSDLVMNHIYFTALIDGAGLAAALARGDGRERVYIVEPTGPFEDDPNVTNKKFPGNPTRSYRTQAPLKIVGEATDWKRLTSEEIQQWRERLANNKGEIIN